MIREGEVTLRPASDTEDSFLQSVYASSRAEELARVPWTSQQKDAFVRMQYVAQKQHYEAEYPQASHDIICIDGAPVGRIYLDRGAEALHILDITVLPQYRNRGIGTFLLGQLLAEAAQGARPVTIYVENFNPSLLLFERLGFARDHEKGFHWLMKWQAKP